MASEIIKYTLIYETELEMKDFNERKLIWGRIGNLFIFKLQYTWD